MLRGCRCIILAIAGLILVGAIEPEKKATSGEQSSAQARNTKTSSIIEVGLPAREPRHLGCDQGKENRNSDLCAQWKAADSAEKSAEWAVYGFWATLAGIALLTWQIMLTRKALKDTGDATRAMREANDLSEGFSKRQLRAYVCLDLVDINLQFSIGDVFSLSVKAVNLGSTPASNVSFSNSLGAAPPDWQYDESVAPRSDTYLTTLHSQIPSNYSMATDGTP